MEGDTEWRSLMETVEDIWKGVDRSRGIPEVGARWVSNNVDRVRLVDVREPGELVSSLGKIGGVENVPLGTLAAAAQSWSKDDPLVAICRSGGRSGRAAMLLESMGFTHVASLDGGMLGWHEVGLPVG